MAAPLPHAPAGIADYLRLHPGDVVGVFDQAAAGFFAAASPPVMRAGMAIFAGLAVITTVQRGAAWALSGQADATGLLHHLLKVAFVLGLLTFWDQTLPGAGASIPQLIAGQGAWLVDALLGDSLAHMQESLLRIWQAFSRAELSGQVWSVLAGLLAGSSSVVLYTILGPAVVASLVVLAIGALAAGLAQVVWAGAAISICIMIGPVLVPWLLWRPMEFLFWGWLKTVLTYSLYGVVAVAVIRTFMDALLIQVEAVVLTTGWAQGGAQVLASALTTFLLGFTALMAMIKVPALANGLVSGSGAAGSGIAEAATQATAGSAAATMGPALQGAGGSLAAAGRPQPSLLGGQPLGVGGSRVAAAGLQAAGGVAGATGQVVSGLAGRQLPLTRPPTGG